MSNHQASITTLVKQIQVVEKTIVDLSSRGARFLVDDTSGDKQKTCAFGALLVELYFLGEAWRRLRERIVLDQDYQQQQQQQQHHHHHSQSDHATTPPNHGSDFTTPAVLDECDNLLHVLNVHFERLSPGAALELQAAALDCRDYVLLVASLQDLGLIHEHLCTFRGGSCFGLSANFLIESTPWFLTQPIALSEKSVKSSSKSSPPAASPGVSHDPTAADVMAWLDIILSPELSRDPDEYYQEEINLRTFRSRHPRFSTAAARWPLFAEAFWPALRPQLSFLFQPPGPYNMVQWALEYARETLPDTFGPNAPSRDALLDLTEALCDGSFTPLHLAAALGLPSLCRAILLMDEKTGTKTKFERTKMWGPYGTPIYCALVGPDVLKCGIKAGSWANILRMHEDPKTRAATISVLLDARHPCQNDFFLGNDERASFVGLAFWVALLSKDQTILERVLKADAVVDESMQSLLQYKPLHALLQSESTDKSFFVRLLVVVFDQLIINLEERLTWTVHGDTNVLEAMEKIMRDYKLSFKAVNDIKGIEWPDEEFPSLVYTYIQLTTFPHGLQRLAQDPRFNPNQPVAEDSEFTGTLMHLAVANDLPDIVDILAQAGADLTALDEEGRTPLMVVESTTMLAKLVRDHGDTTTARDYHGRNIWHYAAATGDYPLLQWLCQHDPWKEQNLKTITNAGCTPAAEAFLYIDEIANMSRIDAFLEPVTARVILNECRDMSYLESSRPLTHVAAAWGRADLVEALVAAGADFREIDQNGRTAMHHLNAFASRPLVQRFQQLCEGLPIHTDHGLTPAETMLKNTVMLKGTSPDDYEATSHPSCYATLGEGFDQVLTPEVLESKDFRGRGLWARFCEAILSLGEAPKVLSFLRNSIMRAIRTLAKRDVLKDYERSTGRSPIYALAPIELQRVKWDHCHQDIILTVLDLSLDSDPPDNFFKSGDAVQLLIDCAPWNRNGLVSLLCSKMPLLEPCKRLGDQTPLGYFIKHLFKHAERLLDRLSADALEPYRAQIINALNSSTTTTDQRASMLRALRSRGMVITREELQDRPSPEGSSPPAST